MNRHATPRWYVPHDAGQASRLSTAPDGAACHRVACCGAMSRRRLVAIALCAATPCCGSDERIVEPGAPCDIVTLELTPDPGDAGEAYQCFGFDAAELGGRAIRWLRWTPPDGGGVTLHHATLIATSEARPAGPAAFGAMPADAVNLHVGAPGGTPLEMPPGVGLALPEGATHLLVEAHALRLGTGPARAAHAEICVLRDPPERFAAWIGVSAPVPAIRPHHVETSTRSCTLAQAFDLVSTWPHMHRVGREFHGTVVRADGSREPLIDLADWNFDAQRTYPVRAHLDPGDAIETTCVWQNPGSEYVLPGRYTTNEMCNQGIIGWPSESAHCATSD